MYQKKVSVIITTFNGSKYIKKQIDSIFAQSILPGEIIVCDDHSSDETVTLLNSYANNDILKIHVNDKKLGVVGNFKKAAKIAKQGNWLVFADQDDIWIPQKLQKLVDAMQAIDDNITPALVYSDLTIIDKDDNVIYESFWDKQKIRPEKINLATLLYGNIVTGCTMIINYPMAEEFFLMDTIDYLHDEWLSLIAYSFGKAKFLNEKLVLYREHEYNVTLSENYKPLGIIDNIKTEIDYLSGKRKFLARQFELANAFLVKYHDKLNAAQIHIIENFIKQEDDNYLLKRFKRRITYS
ncbi:MAG: hypothetical protein JWQ84_1819 [Mucilaginibacter sp.]|nr:hypothetical protein [Mucilaginibacter sp.]